MTTTATLPLTGPQLLAGRTVLAMLPTRAPTSKQRVGTTNVGYSCHYHTVLLQFQRYLKAVERPKMLAFINSMSMMVNHHNTAGLSSASDPERTQTLMRSFLERFVNSHDTLRAVNDGPSTWTATQPSAQPRGATGSRVGKQLCAA